MQNSAQPILEVQSAFSTWMLVCLASSIIGGLIGILRGRGVDGIVLGLLVGPIGWLLIWLGPDKRRKCPACLGVVPEGARKCCHCASDLTAGTPLPPVATRAAIPKPDGNAERLVVCPWCYADQTCTPQGFKAGVICGACRREFVPAVIANQQ